MKLGILIPEFPTQTHIFFWRELVALRGLGTEVYLLSTRRPAESCPHDFALIAASQTHYVYPPKAAAVGRLIANPTRLLRAMRYWGSLSEHGLRGLRFAALIPSAADLADYAARVGLTHVHVHSCADAAHVAALARLMGGPPYSLHLHGDLTVYGGDHLQKMRLASFVCAAARPHQIQLIEKLGLPAARTRTLPMGVDTLRFQPPSVRLAPRGRLELITVARLAVGKGHRYALEAVRSAVDHGADVRYTIVGSGPDRRQVEQQIDLLRLRDRVQMLGSLGEQAVSEQLRKADAFVLASVGAFEASPVAVMEAMSCGLPVIVSRIGGTPEMISDGVDGLLVEPADVPALAAAMESLAQDPGLRTRIGEAARRRAVESFDSTARARQLIAAIERAASNS